MKTDLEIRLAALRYLREHTNKNGQLLREDLGHCWDWYGRRHSSGYGVFPLPVERGRTVRYASRAAWWLKHGDPGKLFVLHKCDNRACVRVDHLFIGTAQDNTDDARAKGRCGLGFHNQKRDIEDISRELRRKATIKEVIMVNTWKMKVFKQLLIGKTKEEISALYLQCDTEYILNLLGIRK